MALKHLILIAVLCLTMVLAVEKDEKLETASGAVLGYGLGLGYGGLGYGGYGYGGLGYGYGHGLGYGYGHGLGYGYGHGGYGYYG